jgi:hypothetical protein
MKRDLERLADGRRPSKMQIAGPGLPIMLNLEQNGVMQIA